jgi:hypothetical protein
MVRRYRYSDDVREALLAGGAALSQLAGRDPASASGGEAWA